MNYYSTIFSRYLSDKDMHSLVSDETFIQKMLQFEAALAKAQAWLDIIPKHSAAEINDALNKIKITAADLAEGTLQNGVPVITLLSLVKKHLSEEVQQHLHYGATSQDVMDTAQVLIIRDAIKVTEEKLDILINALTQLLSEHGDVPCMAHTRGQQAIPITFGVKINAWLQPFQRQIERLNEIKKRILIVQLGGGSRNTVCLRR